MSHSSPLIDDREWHVLVQGARCGPMARAELRALLETHPERWNASVWRPGMLDWRSAGSIRALTQDVPIHGPSWIGPEAPLEDPPRASTPAPRDASGELRVLSYEEHTQGAPLPSPARSMALSGEWSLVVTSELRAISASELHALALKQSSAPETLSELRAFSKEQLLGAAALASPVLSQPTRAELPAFRFPPEPGGAASTAHDAAPSTPPPLPQRRSLPARKRPSALRALSFVLGGLVLLSALALLLIRLR